MDIIIYLLTHFFEWKTYILDAITGLILSLFMCIAIGGIKKHIVRKAFVITVSAALIGFVHYFYSYIGWLETIFVVLILFSASLLCGEKKIYRSASFALISANIALATETIVRTISLYEKTVVIDSMGLNQKIIKLILLSVILTCVFIFVNKRKISLEKNTISAFLLGLCFSTVILVLMQQIFEYNRFNLLTKYIVFGSVKKTVVFSIIVIVSVLLINISVYILIAIINKQNKEKAEYVIMENHYRSQEALLDEATRQQEKLAKLRHDLSNTLGVINGLIASGKFDEATAFIKANAEILSVDTRAVKTNNEYVNAIINYKSSVAKENGIDVSVYSVSDIAFPDNVDFCSLIGNMFDNAIQGAAECKGSRMIRLDISHDGDGYRILMCNSVPAPVLKSNPNLETTKKDRGSHGFGTKIIRQIADKYNGTTDFYDAEGGKFCCSVVVYPEIPVKGTMG